MQNLTLITLLGQNDCTHKITTKKIKRPILLLFSTYDKHECITYVNICTLTWHTIWFDLYKAVYCKLIKPMDYRQARHWHLVNTCTYIVII